MILNVSSNSLITWGGNDDDEERINRKAEFITICLFLPALDRIAWCMVGTAVYQLGCVSSNQAKNFNALNPGVQKILAPAHDTRENGCDQAMDMKQGHHVQAAIRGGEVQGSTDISRTGTDIPLR